MAGRFPNLHKNMGHSVNSADGGDEMRGEERRQRRGEEVRKKKSTWDSEGMTTETTKQYVLF